MGKDNMEMGTYTPNPPAYNAPVYNMPSQHQYSQAPPNQFQPPPQTPYNPTYAQYDPDSKQPGQPRQRSLKQKLLIALHGLILLAGVILFIVTIYDVVRTIQILSWSSVFAFFILFAITSIVADILKITYLVKRQTIPTWTLALEVLDLIFFVLRWVLLIWAVDITNLWDDNTEHGTDLDLVAPTLAVIAFTWIVFVGRLLSMGLTVILVVVHRRRRRQNGAV